MMKTVQLSRQLMIGILLLSLMLSGCGGGDDNDADEAISGEPLGIETAESEAGSDEEAAEGED